MTTTAASNAVKDKMEKRRALGRGLESLLPGPRVVRPAAPADAAADESTGAAGQQQVPFDSASPNGAAPLRAGSHSVRHDNDAGVRNDKANEILGEQAPGLIRAEVDPAYETSSDSGSAASPGSAGRTNASVPTHAFVPTYSDSIPASSSIPKGSSSSEGHGISIQAQAESRIPGNIVVNLAIANIDKNPFQTRYVHNDDALAELRESIKANGVLQPIVVRPAEEDGRYILIVGERRLHASRQAGRETIPALVRRVSEQQAAEMTIIENLQREDLSPLEQAEAFRVLSEEFKLTQAQIGERVGLSRASVANYMRLLRLPREVMQLLAEKKINFAEAKELLRLEDNDQIAKAALFAVKKGMNIEQIERLVMRMEGLLDPIPGMPGTEAKKSGARWVDPNVRSAQVELERLLGVRVKIRDRKGKGKIVIEYSNVDDYERVVGMLKGSGQ
ncbi:MAG: ParB/RepB/Spo0J family partition protein [Candidatus Sulfotelmatobacter sp.]